MTTQPAKAPTTAYYYQAVASFTVALGVVIIGILTLPLAPWTRAFMALGTLFLVSSSFTLAKCVRDRQEFEDPSQYAYESYQLPYPPAPYTESR
ncbi:MAG TPA: YiaA/YiaB family inner membrane protein [Mycobacterium sp.]|nr:YiaA/YiaB family inner membrane protein [Mycobacterium sp.]